MGFFGKVFKRKEEDDPFSSPPDFSQPVGQATAQRQSPPGQDLYGKDPLQNPYDPTPPGAGESAFEHDLFQTSTQPTNAEGARSYARQLAQPTSQQYTSTTVSANPVSGHEAQLILERLDTIKAELDSIKQRMMRVERFIEQNEQKRRYI